MAAERFQFKRDRLKKAFKLPWFVVLAVAAKVVPKKDGFWVFGRRSGFGDGPLALLKEVRRVHATATVLWLTRDPVDDRLAEIHNVPYARYTTWAALWACLRASYGVMTHGFSDLRGPAIWGASVIQLWHGTPVKRVGNDMAPADQNVGRRFASKFAMILQNYWNSHLSLVVAGSPVGHSRLTSSLGVSASRVKILGDPRCDLIAPSSADAKKALLTLARDSGFEGVSKFLLFAPTWRESKSDCMRIDPEDARALDDFLSQAKTLLVVRDHPYSGQEGIGADLVRKIFMPPAAFPDLTSFLGAFDGLITDYSSVAMDYATLGRPIIFLAPDLALYTSQRGLYESYEEFSGGRWCMTWRQVVSLLRELEADTHAYASYLASSVFPLRDKYNQYPSSGNSLRVLEHATRY